MEHQYTIELETQVCELHEGLLRLTSHEPVQELIGILRRPGWTSIAEQTLISGLLDAMIAQMKTLSVMKRVLLDGASNVELNPQPLPPKE